MAWSPLRTGAPEQQKSNTRAASIPARYIHGSDPPVVRVGGPGGYEARSFFTAARKASRSMGFGKKPSGGGTRLRWLMNFSYPYGSPP
jgi:hypothetical protein